MSSSIVKQGMKERPILFNAQMVRALLDGSKTQTRRVCKNQPYGNGTWNVHMQDFQCHNDYLPPSAMLMDYKDGGQTYTTSNMEGWDFCCPYGRPGDQLWVAMDIPGVSRNYCAGSDGRIYSRARGDWRPLRAHNNDNGYPSVTVMDDGRKTTRGVHSLVCAAFYGAAPSNGSQVRHLDGDSQNSTPANLAWGSQAENWLDRRSHGNGIEGEKHHAAKLSNEERSHILWAIDKGLCSKRGAARALGVAQSTIQKMRSNWELLCDPVLPDTRIPPILLEIVSVRVERLNEISEDDCWAEGIDACDGLLDDMKIFEMAKQMGRPFEDAAPTYAALWESINGAGSWNANPWVWVIDFRRIQP